MQIPYFFRDERYKSVLHREKSIMESLYGFRFDMAFSSYKSVIKDKPA